MKQFLSILIYIISISFLSSHAAEVFKGGYILTYVPSNPGHTTIEIATVEIQCIRKMASPTDGRLSVPYRMVIKTILTEGGVAKVKEQYWKNFNLGSCLFRRIAFNPEELNWQYSYFELINQTPSEQNFYLLSRSHKTPDSLYHRIEAKVDYSPDLEALTIALNKAKVEVPSLLSFHELPKPEASSQGFELCFNPLSNIRIPWLALATISVDQINALLIRSELIHGVSWLVPDQRYLSGYSHTVRSTRETLSCCAGGKIFEVPVTEFSVKNNLTLAHAQSQLNGFTVPVRFSYQAYNGLLVYTIADEAILQQIASPVIEQPDDSAPSQPLEQSCSLPKTSTCDSKEKMILSSSAPSKPHMPVVVRHSYEDAEIVSKNRDSFLNSPFSPTSPKGTEGETIFRFED